MFTEDQMASQIELAYILKKEQEDLFESYLMVQTSVQGNQGKIQFLDQAAIEAAADGPDVVMGVRIQQAPNQQILLFTRRSQAGNLEFPDNIEADLQFRKLNFRIRTTLMDNQGHQREFGISYDINKNNYEVIPGNILPGDNWLALVTFVNGNFNLLHVRQEIGSGGGDPCAELGCDEEGQGLISTLRCVLSGCA
jgi:hypothetical protein